MENETERIVILGASRGLGWATYQKMSTRFPQGQFLLVSRKIKNCDVGSNTQIVAQDFSKAPLAQDFLQALIQFNPTQIIYSAGGGPYGVFESKKWSDHEWALNVNFLYPAQLIHEVLSHVSEYKDLKSFTCVGSDIAEAHPDMKASSYCAAKHALKGLITTLQIENSTHIQFKLFSPGYMATDLLPANSAPRQAHKAESPEKVAEKLIDFITSNEMIWSASANR
jgi:short-subunit dehydrogenase